MDFPGGSRAPAHWAYQTCATSPSPNALRLPSRKGAHRACGASQRVFLAARQRAAPALHPPRNTARIARPVFLAGGRRAALATLHPARDTSPRRGCGLAGENFRALLPLVNRRPSTSLLAWPRGSGTPAGARKAGVRPPGRDSGLRGVAPRARGLFWADTRHPGRSYQTCAGTATSPNRGSPMGVV